MVPPETAAGSERQHAAEIKVEDLAAGGPGLPGHPNTPAVQITNLSHWFGAGETRKQALIDNNLTLMPGELVIMTGPSGSGKTTVLTLIGALRTVQEGSLRVMGRELRGLNRRQMTELRRDIGFIFQAHNLFESLTAMQNVKLALELKSQSASERDRLAKEILSRLGLGHRLQYKSAQLSGGQRQRVAIARALVNRPQLVLADEPTAALDKASGREVLGLFKELAQKGGTTILLVTHDSRILDVADRIVNMVDGRIVSEIVVEETVKTIEFLVKCPLFAKYTTGMLTEISQKMRREHFGRGTRIIVEGEEGDKFYLIRDGLVTVTREQAGVSNSLAEMGPGSFFGEAALMSGRPRSATVTAKVDTVAYSLKKGDFLAAIASNASFGDQLRQTFFKRQAPATSSPPGT